MTDIKMGDKYVAKTDHGREFRRGTVVTVLRIDEDGDIWYRNDHGQENWCSPSHFNNRFERRATELDDKWIVWIPSADYFFADSESIAQKQAEAMATLHHGHKVYIAKAQNMVVKGGLNWLN